jgi:ribokinase
MSTQCRSHRDAVAVVGNATMDQYLIELKSWPAKTGARYSCTETQYRLGGNASAVAIAMAAMSDVDVSVFTGIGHGGHGRAFMKAFRNKGLAGVPNLIGSISCENSNPTAAVSTGTTIIRLDGGEPDFITCPGANKTVTCTFLRKHVAKIAFARHLHIGGIGNVLHGIEYDDLEEFLLEVRQKNPSIIISLDVVLPSEQASFAQDLHLLLFRVLKQVDFFLPNAEEAYLFAGIEPRPRASEGLITEAARRLNHAHIRQATIVKCGAKGVRVFPRTGNTFDVPAEQVRSADIEDTVGAGDTWDAGFIISQLKGYGLRESCRVANRVAASCIKALGATAGILPLKAYTHGIELKVSA